MIPAPPLLTDKEIGARVRSMRKARGMSQQKLALMIGLSFQQIQKYERGVNTIKVGRLEKIAHALDTPLGYFFGPEYETCNGAAINAHAVEIYAALGDPEIIRLLKAYGEIDDPEVRRQLVLMTEALAGK